MHKNEYKIGLELLKNESEQFVSNIDNIAPNIKVTDEFTVSDISKGVGIEKAFSLFKHKYGNKISATTGPNYYGFIIGGATPAALLGDWLTSLYDQCSPLTDVTNVLENEVIEQSISMFGLSSDFNGTLVSGATVSNMVNLAIARQWVGEKQNYDIAKKGLINSNLNIKIYSATPHSSIFKSLSIIGIGRESVEFVGTKKGRESIDVNSLRQKLSENKGVPCIVIGNAGTVNTGDFDDFLALEKLKEEFGFWLHIDAAFGGFANCSNKHKYLLEGWNSADSITIDAHKWLNVPYDSAFQFTKHTKLQSKVFQNGDAPYLDNSINSYINLTPENSRRWRALPIWFSFQAYGIDGISEMINNNCKMAEKTAQWIDNSEYFTLLSEIKLNIVCFKVRDIMGFSTETFLNKVNGTQKVFMTPTNYKGEYAIRIAFSNWSNNNKNVDELTSIFNDIASSL
ncbi:MAG: aspartate aminotransferase family protein [Flavobacteriaceae bacterium]|nr:aspartate aminotransferase family protein [Flavobacteriaceae bacterium]